MKATGIVRRIDDLGRIVIPKEIRRTLRIREGDPLEIYTDISGEIVLKKYSHIGEIENFAKQYADTLAKVSGYPVFVTDREEFIAVAGSGKKEILGDRINQKLEEIIENRDSFSADKADKKYVKLFDKEDDEYQSQIISTIICQGDAIGTVIMVSKDDKLSATEQKLVNAATQFIGRHLED